jgi:glc operon protein GlcG
MSLTADFAVEILRAALRLGRERKLPIAAVVTDLAGRTLAAGRSEDCGFLNLTAAERKAVTSANFKAPTQAVLDMVKGDPILIGAVSAESSINVLPGGFPIVQGGLVVGAFGIAGGHYSQDQALGEEVLKSVSKG